MSEKRASSKKPKTSTSVSKTLDLFRDHMDQLSKDLKEFNQRREQIEKEMRDGGIPRPRGRIV